MMGRNCAETHVSMVTQGNPLKAAENWVEGRMGKREHKRRLI
jgi:hypothetical protein